MNVKALNVVLEELLLEAVSANDRNTVEGLGEVREDGSAGQGFEALNLDRRAAVVHLHQVVDHQEDGHCDQNPGVAWGSELELNKEMSGNRGTHGNGSDSGEEGEEVLNGGPEHVEHVAIEDRHVGGEASNDASWNEDGVRIRKKTIINKDENIGSAEERNIPAHRSGVEEGDRGAEGSSETDVVEATSSSDGHLDEHDEDDVGDDHTGEVDDRVDPDV